MLRPSPCSAVCRAALCWVLAGAFALFSLADWSRLCRGGGSVFLATSRLDWRLLRPCGAERFEDGTLPFLNILGLSYGLVQGGAARSNQQ